MILPTAVFTGAILLPFVAYVAGVSLARDLRAAVQLLLRGAL